jgi:hypothetical protein
MKALRAVKPGRHKVRLCEIADNGELAAGEVVVRARATDVTVRAVVEPPITGDAFAPAVDLDTLGEILTKLVQSVRSDAGQTESRH